MEGSGHQTNWSFVNMTLHGCFKYLNPLFPWENIPKLTVLPPSLTSLLPVKNLNLKAHASCTVLNYTEYTVCRPEWSGNSKEELKVALRSQKPKLFKEVTNRHFQRSIHRYFVEQHNILNLQTFLCQILLLRSLVLDHIHLGLPEVFSVVNL